MIGIENVREPEEIQTEENEAMALARKIKPLLEQISHIAMNRCERVFLYATPDGYVDGMTHDDHDIFTGIDIVSLKGESSFSVYNRGRDREQIGILPREQKESQEEEASQDSK